TADAVKARFYAQSAVELGLSLIEMIPNWRNAFVNDVWNSELPIEEGTYSLKIVDELDANLADDSAQPVRLYAKATVGQAVRIYSVQLQLDKGSDISTTTFERRISAQLDDVEQNINTGWMYTYSTDLELAFDPEGDPSVHTHLVGMRFNNVDIPQGAVIANAYIQFQVDEISSSAVSLSIRGEDIDYAPQFTTGAYNLSLRTKTSAAVSWSPPPWGTADEAGIDQRTPDISPVIQEIVDRSYWANGYSMVIIIEGSGTRTAKSWDGVPSAAPLLHVEWNEGGTMVPVPGTWRREILP
ncbi:MAG: hypothetical protein ACYTF1_23275, partial [Planctomycetota bacterium]